MKHRKIVSAALAAVIVCSAGAAHAAPEPLYPVLDCWDQVSPTEVRLHLGVTSLASTEVSSPEINQLNVGANTVATPTSFSPGYHSRVFSLTVSTTEEVVSWALGQVDYVLFIDPSALDPDERCVTGPSSLSGCHTVTANLPEGKDFGTELTISCGAGEMLLQGGGTCAKGNLRGSAQVDASSWKVTCRSPKGIAGSALCCPVD